MQDVSIPGPIGPGPENPNDLWSWVIYIVGTLAAALFGMWKINETRNSRELEQQRETVKRLEEKIDKIDESRLDCEKDRSRLAGECNELRRRVEMLEKQ